METVPYNAKADQWAADCAQAGWAQHWGDVAAWAAANGQGRWYWGAAAWLAVWAMLLLAGGMAA